MAKIMERGKWLLMRYMALSIVATREHGAARVIDIRMGVGRALQSRRENNSQGERTLSLKKLIAVETTPCVLQRGYVSILAGKMLP